MLNNNELIKKNLFKVKKITIMHKNYEGKVTKTEENIAILVPSFDNYRKLFKENCTDIIQLDGIVRTFRNDELSIENTRIMDNKIRESLDKLIEFSKEKYKFQKEKAKLYEDFRKKEEALNKKDNKNDEKVEKLINQLKKSQGILSNKEVLKALEGLFGHSEDRFIKAYYNSEAYKLKIHSDRYLEKELLVNFQGNKLDYINYSETIRSENYMADTYDFTYQEYDDSYHIDSDLEESQDFKRIKEKNFKNIKQSELDKIKATERFSAEVGDKNCVYVGRDINLDFNLECNKENLKEIKNRFKGLLKLI